MGAQRGARGMAQGVAGLRAGQTAAPMSRGCGEQGEGVSYLDRY